MSFSSNPTAPGVSLNAGVGDILSAYSDGQITTQAETYAKAKEIRLPRGGTYRVKFSMKTQNVAAIAYARVYRNGAAVGAEQTNGTTSYETKEEDISGWATGDLLQLYHKKSGGGYNCYIKDFRVYSELNIDHEVVI